MRHFLVCELHASCFLNSCRYFQHLLSHFATLFLLLFVNLEVAELSWSALRTPSANQKGKSHRPVWNFLCEWGPKLQVSTSFSVLWLSHFLSNQRPCPSFLLCSAVRDYLYWPAYSLRDEWFSARQPVQKFSNNSGQDTDVFFDFLRLGPITNLVVKRGQNMLWKIIEEIFGTSRFGQVQAISNWAFWRCYCLRGERQNV